MRSWPGEQVVVDHLVAGGAGAVGEARHVVDAERDVRLRAGLNGVSTPQCTFTRSLSNQQPPRLASSGGFGCSGRPSRPA